MKTTILLAEDYDFVIRLMLKVKRAVLIKNQHLLLLDYSGRSVFNDKQFKILKRYFYFKKKYFNNEFKNLN